MHSMKLIKRKFFLTLSFVCLSLLMTTVAGAQEITANYAYKIDTNDVTEAPQFLSGFNVPFPEEARENGVEGTLKLKMTLGEDGKVRDIAVSEGLPFGISEAVVQSLEQLRFEPAKRNGQPAPVTMFFDYTVTLVFNDFDKNVIKPKILEKPAPVYPPNQRGEKLKGKVSVEALFSADGTAQVLSVNSVMPKEFDRAAAEAAKLIKFQPAVHKKSKKAVSQKMTVEYEFKP